MFFVSIAYNLLICGQKVRIIYRIGSYCGLFVVLKFLTLIIHPH